jgi:hypothetical protein
VETPPKSWEPSAIWSTGSRNPSDVLVAGGVRVGDILEIVDSQFESACMPETLVFKMLMESPRG